MVEATVAERATGPQKTHQAEVVGEAPTSTNADILRSRVESMDPEIAGLFLMLQSGIDVVSKIEADGQRVEAEKAAQLAKEAQAQRDHELAMNRERDIPRMRWGVAVLTIALLVGAVLAWLEVPVGGSLVTTAMMGFVAAGGYLAGEAKRRSVVDANERPTNKG